MEIKVEPIGEEEARRRDKNAVKYQLFVCLLANVSVLGPSMGFGYSAVAIGPLMSPSSDIKVNESQANWIATAAALGAPFGCILSSYVMRRGRKISLLVTSAISLIGWLTIYLSGSYEQILVGRAISGVASGLASVPATVYSAEVAGPKWRSTIITWTSTSIAVGILIVYSFGYIFQENWRLIALMCAVFPTLSIIITLLAIPETPAWLRDHGRTEDALRILKRFRGVPHNQPPPSELLLELQPKYQPKRQNLRKHLMKRTALIPFAIMLGYFFFQQFSGLFVIVYYAVDITKEAGVQIDPTLGAVLIGLTRLVGCFVVSYVSRKFGRRIPSIISGVGMTFFMFVLTFYLFMADKGCPIKDDGVIPVICILMYIFMSTLGFLVLPFAMIGEVYPAKVKDVLSGLTTCIGYIFSSFTIKAYPDMLASMGKDGVFLFYAVLALAGTIFVAMFLPETKGKTLDEIEEMYAKKKDHDVLVLKADVAMVNGKEEMAEA